MHRQLKVKDALDLMLVHLRRTRGILLLPLFRVRFLLVLVLYLDPKALIEAYFFAQY